MELPKFKKTLEELRTLTEKWIYFLINAGSLEQVPNTLNVGPIANAFTIANTSRMSPSELESYEKKLMFIQDEIGRIRLAERRGIETGIEIGKQQGVEIGKQQIAKDLLASGKLPLAEIVKITGFSEVELQKLQEK